MDPNYLALLYFSKGVSFIWNRYKSKFKKLGA